MIELIILIVFFILAIALLIFAVKKVVKLAVVVGVILLILVIIGSLTNMNLVGVVKEKTTEIVGMVVGVAGDKAVDFAKENVNMTQIKNNIVNEVKDK